MKRNVMVTQISQISQIFSGSPTAQNLNENLINKNLENPFDLVETASLLLQRHATSCKQACSLSLPLHQQSLRDFNQDERKTKIIDS